MTRPSVPAVPPRDSRGRYTAIEALADTEPRQTIRGQVVRLDQPPAPVRWVPGRPDSETPFFARLDAEWLHVVGATFTEADRILRAKRLQHCATGDCR